MEKIKIKIKELGAIKNSEIELSPVMIFSGESGLGKSYLALLCHYFFELLINTSRLNHFFIDKSYKDENYDFNVISKKRQDSGMALRIKKHDLETWMANDAIIYLRYMLGYAGVSGSIKIILPETFPDTMIFTYKRELTGLVNKEDVDTILSLGNLSFRIKEKTQFDESPFAFLLRFVMIEYIFGNYQMLDCTFVFPPSRGPILSEQIIPNTGMYYEFLNDMTELNRISQRPENVSDIVLRLFRTIMEGEVNKEETAYIYKTKNTSMPVSAAAASIREIAPLQILAKKQDVSKCAILLEEPEAHLHPLKQRMMADIIGALSHSGAIMQITTHSDYFIRRLNELIMFAKAKKIINDPKKLRALSIKVNIEDEMSIDESIIGAYLLQKQSDGRSMVKKQTLSNYIPFTAFKDAILENMNNQDILEYFLQDETK